MAITLVYAGEHFVADEVAGYACAAAVYFWGSRLLDRWNARRRPAGPTATIAASPRHDAEEHGDVGV
jgi:hypothetical protein